MKKLWVIVATVIVLVIVGLGYFFLPQASWVPAFLKPVVASCIKENDYVRSISDMPKCCLGLSEQAIYPDSQVDGVHTGVVGAMICGHSDRTYFRDSKGKDYSVAK